MEVLVNVNGFYGGCHAIVTAFVNTHEILEVMKKINFKIFEIACFVLCFCYIVLSFYLIVDNSLLLFFSSILPPTVTAWLGVRGPLRLGEMCSDPNSVAWQIITCGVSTNIVGAYLKSQVHLCAKRHTCPPPVLSWRLRPEGRCAHSCASQSLLAALPLLRCPESRCGHLTVSLTRQPVSTAVCQAGSGVTAVGTRWKRRGLLAGNPKSDQEFPSLYISCNRLNLKSFYLMKNLLFPNLYPFKLNVPDGSLARECSLRKTPDPVRKQSL